MATASTRAVGSHAAQWGGRVKISEPLLNVVNENKAKVLSVLKRNHRLGPTGALTGSAREGKGSSPGAPNSPGANGAPPAERRNLSHLNQVRSWTVVFPPVTVVHPQGKRTVR